MFTLNERFKGHKLSVFFDNGFLTELVYTKGSKVDFIKIIAYQDGLLYTGDLGTFVFENSSCNMLALFNNKPNLSYWGEKCVSGDYRQINEESIREAFQDYDLPGIEDSGVFHAETMEEIEAIAEDNGWDIDVWDMYFEGYTIRFKMACHILSEIARLYWEGKK